MFTDASLGSNFCRRNLREPTSLANPHNVALRGSNKKHLKSVPVLMLLRQEGSEGQGWRGLPFWWPVIVVPRDAVTSVFAAEAPEEDTSYGFSYGGPPAAVPPASV
jgi:hypothetical protein